MFISSTLDLDDKLPTLLLRVQNLNRQRFQIKSEKRDSVEKQENSCRKKNPVFYQTWYDAGMHYQDKRHIKPKSGFFEVA